MEARAASGSSSSVSFHLRRGVWWWVRLRVELGFSDSLVHGFECEFEALSCLSRVLSIGFEASPSCSLMVAARGLLVTGGDVCLFSDLPCGSRSSVWVPVCSLHRSDLMASTVWPVP
ncbi:unnamed protein product [Brassica napus]|uniref:(rape) hypothetical protein n=1 Tax=Brassica napus TaxID=3708 RepID=A0A817B1G3_BRANA|nr:unnamed protein product [Brassica napus]